MKILAIDPGNKKSGWLLFEPADVLGGLKLVDFGISDNVTMRTSITSASQLIIETPKPQGMAMAAETMDTLIQIGRLVDRWVECRWLPPESWSYVFRQPVKLHLCGQARAKDKNVRQALIDRFGGNTVAVGGVKCPRCHGKGWCGRGRPVCEECGGQGWESPPGPLKGVSSHVWPALALACWWVDVGANQPMCHQITTGNGK